MPTTLYLMRHGEVHNPDQILYGRMPNFYLSATGRNQAQSAGRYLHDKNIQAVYSSPMERAVETATIVTEQLPSDLAPKIDERIIEVHTPHDGRPLAELEAMNWDLYSNNPPKYEQPSAILQRTSDFIQTVRQQHFNESFLAVAHGDILVFWFLHVLGQAPQPAKKETLEDFGLPERYPATASFFTFTFQTDAPDEIPLWSYTRPY